VDLTGSALGSIEGCCEFCNEPTSIMNSGQFLDHLNDFSLTSVVSHVYTL
jgi:hypothetical protein